MSAQSAGAVDPVVRLLYGEGRPSAYELARPEVLEELAFVLRTLAIRAARGTDESPEQLVDRLVREATERMATPPGVSDDDRTRALQQIRDMAQAGNSSYTIAAALNTEGVPSPHGRRWHRRAVEALLAEAFALEEQKPAAKPKPGSLHRAG